MLYFSKPYLIKLFSRFFAPFSALFLTFWTVGLTHQEPALGFGVTSFSKSTSLKHEDVPLSGLKTLGSGLQKCR